MTDWGYYAPGPWIWQDDNLVSEDGRLIVGGDGSFKAVVPMEDEARLISKAYLIPRLEAAVEHLTHLVVKQTPKRTRECGCAVPVQIDEVEETRALLEELRAS